ncbi:hypothetical protein ACIREO_23920 [Streptomyces sp. NPDC102441]|uniref:hypothetical protein n=1 Tax=Streptomyces sp. NPDC102441 TaxID=3366176 RepID=UPI003819CA5B
MTKDLVYHLSRASDAVQSAQRLLPPPGAGPAENHLPDASAAVHAVRDVIESHRGPDRVPLTAYAYGLTTGPAHHYLTRRCSELAWGAAQVASGLAQDSVDPAVAAAFGDVRHFLSEASVFTAMQRLLAGRVLLTVSEELPDEAAVAALRESAGALRASAQAWQKSATAWHRIVDIADPRSHPKLTAPSYEIVRRGEVVRLPQSSPIPPP